MREVEGLTRRFTTEISPLIGPDRDIPAPDVNTNAQTMAWIMDTYSMHHGYTIAGVVTGKPIAVGGSLGRNEATARGAVFTLLQWAEGERPGRSTGARVAIQGYGNAGSIAATLLAAEGATIVAVSDSTGGIHNPAGLDPAKVSAWKQEHGTVVGFPGSDEVTNQEILELDCEILVPAALENQITRHNAPSIKAKVVAEAANGPTTPEADEILYDRGVFVIPDILCNAGGVTVSYFEWVQDMQSFFWTEDRINDSLKGIMDRAFEDVHAMSRASRGRHAHRRLHGGRGPRGRGDHAARPLPLAHPRTDAGAGCGADASVQPARRRAPMLDHEERFLFREEIHNLANALADAGQLDNVEDLLAEVTTSPRFDADVFTLERSLQVMLGGRAGSTLVGLLTVDRGVFEELGDMGLPSEVHERLVELARALRPRHRQRAQLPQQPRRHPGPQLRHAALAHRGGPDAPGSPHAGPLQQRAAVLHRRCGRPVQRRRRHARAARRASRARHDRRRAR